MGFSLGGLSNTLAGFTDPIESLIGIGQASYDVALRDGPAAGVAYGAGSLVGLTQITEAVAGENFQTGRPLEGLDRWGVAFGGISGLSGAAALGLGIAGYNPTLSLGDFAAENAAADTAATGFRGSKGFELRNASYQPVRNLAGEVNGRAY
ncbi:MAG: hypothetical protein ACP5O1_11590 [Phycisphaerae bacterium]